MLATVALFVLLSLCVAIVSIWESRRLVIVVTTANHTPTTTTTTQSLRSTNAAQRTTATTTTRTQRDQDGFLLVPPGTDASNKIDQDSDPAAPIQKITLESIKDSYPPTKNDSNNNKDKDQDASPFGDLLAPNSPIKNSHDDTRTQGQTKQQQQQQQQQQIEEEPVSFIPWHDFHTDLDFFSATWWQSKERFQQTLDPHAIQNVEGAAFSFWSTPSPDTPVRMTSDWLQYSVEHLSKAWKVTGFEFDNPDTSETQAYHMFVDKLLNYTGRTLRQLLVLRQKDVPTQPKQPSTTRNQKAGKTITFHSATMSSLQNITSTTILSPLGSISATSSVSQPSLVRNNNNNAMPETIALIAFMPYGEANRQPPTRGQVLTTASLAATLTSLIRVQCGRILIVVNQETDWNHVTMPIVAATRHVLLPTNRSLPSHADGIEPKQPPPPQYPITKVKGQRQELESYFTVWSASDKNNNSNHNVDDSWLNEEYKVHNTEISVVLVNCTEQEETKRGDLTMIPKAALLGLQQAFAVDPTTRYAQQWLGRRSHNRQQNDQWNYVYLTEPDTILQARLAALPALSRQLQQGNIVVPHRLQPIPHERDLPNHLENTQVILQPLREHLSTQVHSLHSDEFACCDQGPDHPGNQDDMDCGTFWWQCGFGEEDQKRKNMTSSNKYTSPHFRLASYQFMELLEGTRIVSLAGTEHGRQCVPQPRRAHGTSC
ncbi:hypothetical protein ACA910_011872 [Epithemia clementina (nom. ined.)]